MKKDNLTLYYRAKLNGSKPEWFHFILQAYTAFFDKTWTTMMLTGDCGFVIAVSAKTEDPIACIIFEETSKEEWYIVKSFTEEDYRGQGINGTLFKELSEQAKKKGIHKIISKVSPGNKSMLKALKKVDREINYYATEFKIEQP